MPREDTMVQGGRERLRPKLMTALTTRLSQVPIVVQEPTLAGVYDYSTALVIMGGLAVSTFLTIVLLPTTVTIVGGQATLRLDGIGIWPDRCEMARREEALLTMRPGF